MNTDYPKMRRCVTIHGNGTFKLEAFPMPELEPGTVLIEARASLISPGTELKQPAKPGSKSPGGWRGSRALQLDPDPGLTPRAFGYANSGVVRALGA